MDRIVQRLSPLQRPMEAADYTGHYVLLASRADSRTVTGSVHNCDGGMGVRGRGEEEAASAAALSGE